MGMFSVCSLDGPKFRDSTAALTEGSSDERLPGADTLTPTTDPLGVMEKFTLMVPPAVGLDLRRSSYALFTLMLIMLILRRISVMLLPWTPICELEE